MDKEVVEIGITKEKGRMKLSKLDRGCFLYAEQVENSEGTRSREMLVFCRFFLGISRAGLHC